MTNRIAAAALHQGRAIGDMRARFAIALQFLHAIFDMAKDLHGLSLWRRENAASLTMPADGWMPGGTKCPILSD